jgi:hypothetical protein
VKWQKIHRTGVVERLYFGNVKGLDIRIFLYIYRLDNESDKPAYRVTLSAFCLESIDFGGWNFKTVNEAKKWIEENPAIIKDIVSWCNKYFAITNKISESRRLKK